MTRPGPNVTSDADTQPGSDSLFPTGFSGGGALVRQGSVGTGEIADGSIAAADLNLASVAAAVAARSELTGTYAGLLDRRLFPRTPSFNVPALSTDVPTTSTSGTFASSAVSGRASANPSIAYSDQASVTLLGWLPVLVNQFSTNYWQNQVNAQSGSGAAAGAIEFDHYGSDFEVLFRNASSMGSLFWIWVDGAPTTTRPQYSDATFGGGAFQYRVTFGAWAWRRIRIYMAGADYGGLNIQAAAAVVATPKPKLSLAVIGDSYTQDTGCRPFEGFAWLLGRALGAEVFNMGWGGTGYTTSNGFGAAARVAPLATIKPTFVLFAGSINDAGASASAAGAAATAAFAAAKAASPASRLLVSAVQANAGSMSAANTSNGAAVAAAAATAGAISVTDPIASGWITGTGHAALPAPQMYTPAVSGSGGTFSAGTYYYVATQTTSGGETVKSNEVSATVGANGTIQLKIGASSPGSTGVKVYRGTSAGAENALIYSGTNTSPTDTGGAGSAATPPASDTTANLTGNGTADVFVGADGIHSSVAGHQNGARRIFDKFMDDATL